MGKLGTLAVNGPEGDVVAWDAVDWRQAEDNVGRLRQRIFTASKAGDLKKVRSLQKLMLRSRSGALVSVRRVTEVNAGRKTAGVDGRIVLAGWEKAVYRFRTRRRCCGLQLARSADRGQDRGLCLFACST